MHSNAFQTADVVVVVLYLLTTFVVGILAHRFWRSGETTDEEYYLAGRRVPAWVNGVSYAATAINADVAPLYCGLAAVIGLPVAWFYISRFGLAWFLVAMLFAVRWRQLNIRTGPEFYALRFGGRAARFIRIYSSLFTVAINIVPWIGAGLLGAHMILSPVLGPVLGTDSRLASLLCIVPLVAIYVWVSGYAGVLATDVFQSLVIVASSVALAAIVLAQAGGASGLAEQILAAHPTEHAEILSPLPVPGHEILGPLVVLGWLIVPTIGRGGSVDVDGQRLFSCRTPREAAKMTLWAQGAMFVMLLLLTLPVLGLLSRYPELYHAPPREREQAYGKLLVEYLPSGLLGLAIAGVLASVMSTISGLLCYGSQTIVNDLLRQLFPSWLALDPKSSGSVWVGRLVILAITACGVLVMFAADSLFQIAVVISGMFASSAAFLWAQWWWWRVNVWSWISAMVGGPIVYILLRILLPWWPWWRLQMLQSEAAADAMALLQAIIAIVVTTTLWVTVTLLTRPERKEVLVNFYRQARPMGAWSPIRRYLESESSVSEVPQGLMLGGIMVASLGAIGMASLVVGASQCFVGRWELGAALIVLAAIIAIVFRFAFQWHMDRLQAE